MELVWNQIIYCEIIYLEILAYLFLLDFLRDPAVAFKCIDLYFIWIG